MLPALAFLLFWIIVAVALFFVALRGGPRGARATLQSQTPASRRTALVVFSVFYLAIGVVVPVALGIGNHDSANAKVGDTSIHLTRQEERGAEIFGQSCQSCHTLAAAHATGKVGPNLDQLKPPKALILDALANGRQRGNGTMPAGLVGGPDAQAVAAFVAKVAGQ
jgi:cytochrome c5